MTDGKRVGVVMLDAKLLAGNRILCGLWSRETTYSLPMSGKPETTMKTNGDGGAEPELLAAECNQERGNVEKEVENTLRTK